MQCHIVSILLYLQSPVDRIGDQEDERFAWKCDFSDADGSATWCGTQQVGDDDADWRIVHGHTATFGSGPHYDEVHGVQNLLKSLFFFCGICHYIDAI